MIEQSTQLYLAHVREADKCTQTLETHLFEVSGHCKKLANKINADKAGELIGLLHDFGKYSARFQNYIRSGSGLIDPDLDETYVDAKALKGKIDHSSSGAQWVWHALGKNGEGRLCAQIMALCIASHHSGLIDNLQDDGEKNLFKKRIEKPEEQVHLNECIENADDEIKLKAKALATPALLQIMRQNLRALNAVSPTVKCFNLGFWTRFLFIYLIDNDRISSADFENPGRSAHRNQAVSWDIAIYRLMLF